MEQYVGEIRPVGFNFAPVGWLSCNGQLVSIADFEVLYQLLGTTYGGDGQTTFGLPDLRGRLPISQGNYAGNTYQLGQMGGTESVTLTTLQLPQHVHPIAAQDQSASNVASPASAYFSANSSNQYQPSPGDSTTGNMLAPVGQSQSHSNLMPFQVVNYIIATEGIYPSSN